MNIVIESPEEIQKQIVGAKLIEFQVLPDGKIEEAYCADKEILMNFSNGKEMRIYIDEKGNLRVYSD